jgi:hypothetical protein
MILIGVPIVLIGAPMVLIGVPIVLTGTPMILIGAPISFRRRRDWTKFCVNSKMYYSKFYTH